MATGNYIYMVKKQVFTKRNGLQYQGPLGNFAIRMFSKLPRAISEAENFISDRTKMGARYDFPVVGSDNKISTLEHNIVVWKCSELDFVDNMRYEVSIVKCKIN